MRLDGLEKNANKENKQYRDDMRRCVEHAQMTNLVHELSVLVAIVTGGYNT